MPLVQWMKKKTKRKALYNSLIKLAWNATTYHIWFERNTRIHQSLFHSEFEIV
ncbi:hypothetical protein SLEP1_g47919 [Rubroshorea leprosula]|uniref:Uncharacterized protein n=1 Tax=Rubroshorea leprosula TaxID=152421 RepID=A0AAV5LS13_9ROSI|nr:hypothetical protein SLEP1_g47919 [Rubroshorea leprosula]